MTEGTRAKALRVRDVMQRDPVTIDRGASMRDLAELLSYQDISGVPVVERGTEVVGVVTATDIVRLATERPESAWKVDESGRPTPSSYFAPEAPTLARGFPGGALADLRVEEIMTPATFSVREEATLPELAAFLVKAGVHRALVMEGGHLRGVVTSMDVMRALAEEAE